MRRALSMALAAVIALVAAGAGIAGQPVRAADEDVHVWVNIANKRPAVGCSVDVSVEVRSGGNPVVGAAVNVALFVDNDVVSTDKEATGSNGVAWLSFDTSSAYAGANGWLDVNVGGKYIGGSSILPSGSGGCSGDGTAFNIDATVPVDSGASADSGNSGASTGQSSSGTGNVSGHMIQGVPTHGQEHNLSCEYASLQIATGVFGNPIPEDDFTSVVGYSDNPHWGYRGNIDGWWGNTTDYGVYAEPLADALPQFGFTGRVFYAEGDPQPLKDAIDAGTPTLVWIGEWGDTGFYAYTSDGTRYKLAAGDHVVVAYGYDDSGIYVSDPATAAYRFISWGDFMYQWNVFDGMSLAVSPQ
jgi:uncharacterized protein YvpB